MYREHKILVGGVLLVAVVILTILGFVHGYLPNSGTMLISRLESAAEAQLGRIQAIGMKLDSTKAESEKWNESTVVKATGVKPDVKNTIVLNQEYLADLTKDLQGSGKPRVLLCNPEQVVDAASLVRNRRWPNGDRVSVLSPKEYIQELIDGLIRLRYVLAVRKTAYKPGEWDKEHALSFLTGNYQADVFLFDLETGQMLGGFDIAVVNSNIFRDRIDDGALDRDLARNAEYDLKEILKQRLPTLAKSEQFCSRPE